MTGRQVSLANNIGHPLRTAEGVPVCTLLFSSRFTENEYSIEIERNRTGPTKSSRRRSPTRMMSGNSMQKTTKSPIQGKTGSYMATLHQHHAFHKSFCDHHIRTRGMNSGWMDLENFNNKWGGVGRNPLIQYKISSPAPFKPILDEALLGAKKLSD